MDYGLWIMNYELQNILLFTRQLIFIVLFAYLLFFSLSLHHLSKDNFVPIKTK